MTVTDRIAMNLQSILPVFQVIRDRSGFGGQFLRLPHGHKSRVQVISQRRRKDESARFNADDSVDLHSLEFSGERIHGLAQSFRVFQQRRDVVKVNAGLGKIRHFTN